MSGKKIFNGILIGLAVIGLIFTFVYVIFIIKDKGLYTNMTSTYAGYVTDPQTGEKLSPLAVSYHENYNNFGKEVVEFKIRSYEGPAKQVLYERGYQLIIDQENGNELWYYDTVYGNSFPSGHRYDETNEDGQAKEFYYIEIDGELWALRLDGNYTVSKTYTDGWKVFRTIAFLGLNLIREGTDFSKTDTETIYYTMEDLLLRMKDIVKGSSYGSGDYTMPLIDLGDFLHMYEVKEGSVSDTPVGDGTLINSYFAIDISYDRRGLSYAGQSMFNSVANDSNYNITGVDFDVNYYQSNAVVNLTENDFDRRYSELNKKYYYYLPTKLINELNSYKNIEINIHFNCTSLSHDILGFDYFALSGLKNIQELKITNFQSLDFTLLYGSLNDTNIQKILVSNVNIINQSGQEVAYEMV